MSKYFDDEERDLKEPSRDTEVRLTSIALVGIVFALLLLCGLCFSFGYWMGGHRAPARSQASSSQHLSQTAAPDQEPLQGNGSVPKPSAVAQVPAAPSAQSADAASQQAPDSNQGNSQADAANSGQSTPAPASSSAASPSSTRSPVHPAMAPTPSSGQPSSAAAAQNVRPALPSANQLMVQVAAVSQQQDASVLVTALRAHGYSATGLRDPADGLIHVRIGPFSTREEANRMARRLLDDGYNAMVQP